MSGMQLVEKTCQKCGETKPLSEFHRDRSRRDGRARYCKPCAIAAVARSQERRRQKMGDEDWKKYQNAARRRAYEGGNTRDRAQRQAWAAAERRLREAHSDEWAAYYREERYKRGLPLGS